MDGPAGESHETGFIGRGRGRLGRRRTVLALLPLTPDSHRRRPWERRVHGGDHAVPVDSDPHGARTRVQARAGLAEEPRDTCVPDKTDRTSVGLFATGATSGASESLRRNVARSAMPNKLQKTRGVP